MPEAIKEGGGANDVAAPEDGVPPAAVDLATDGAVEVKPPPATEPSLPDTKDGEDKTGEQEMAEIAPEVQEPPKEQSVADKILVNPLPSSTTNKQTESCESAKGAAEEANPEKELEDMIAKGRMLLTVKRDHYEAAEILSKACEKSSEIFGELSEKCAELYYLYGCSMLECARSESNILGESLKTKDADKDNEADDEEGGVSDGEKGGDEEEEKQEEMEVDDVEENKSDVGTASTSNGAAEAAKENDEAEDVTKEDEEEDEDTSLKLSWQMFELAKVAYTRQDNKERLAETLIKLGEVGVESGHPTAMDDMLAALEIRQKLFPNKRIIPETHFHIGLGYSMFEMFDEAISHFEKAKALLEEIALNLEKDGNEESAKEAKEIRDLLPDLKEKIQDMNDSKVEKRKEMEEALKNGLSAVFNKENGSHCPGTSSEKDKPASNISHLIKRKRKLDEVTSDLPTKVEEPKRKLQAVEVDEEHSSTSSISTSDSNKLEKKESDKPMSLPEESSRIEEPMETEEAKSAVSSLTKCTSNVTENKEIDASKTVSPAVEKNDNLPSAETSSDNKQEIKKSNENNIISSKERCEESKNLDENMEVEMKEVTNKAAVENKTESAVTLADERTKSEGSNSEDKTKTVTKVEKESISKNEIETVADKTQVESEPKSEPDTRTEITVAKTSCSADSQSKQKDIVEAEGEISSTKQQEAVTESEDIVVLSIMSNVENKTETAIQENKLEKDIVKSSVDTAEQKGENMEVTSTLSSDEKTSEGGSENKENTTTNNASEEVTDKNVLTSTTNDKEAPVADSTISKSSTDSPKSASKLASGEVKKDTDCAGEESNNCDSGDTTSVTNGCANEKTELKANNTESIVAKDLEECSRVTTVSAAAPSTTTTAAAAAE